MKKLPRPTLAQLEARAKKLAAERKTSVDHQLRALAVANGFMSWASLVTARTGATS